MPHPVIPNATESRRVAATSRAILTGAPFRRLLGVRLTSQIADGWFQAGLAGSLLFNPDRQSSPVAIAAGFAILLLPYSLLGPYVGVLLDRWDRRASLSTANLARAVMVLPAAALLWSGLQGLGFAVCALIVIAINRFFLAGLSASLPHVVEERKLVPANALASTLGTICYSIGLFTAASVVALQLVGTDRHGYGLIAATAALGYLASGLLARRFFRRDELGPDAHERATDSIRAAVVVVFRGMISGARHLASRGRAARIMVLQSAYRFLYGVLTLAVLLLYSRYFGKAAERTATELSGAAQSMGQLGLVVLFGAAGAAVAAVLTPLAVRWWDARRWLTGAVAAVGVVVLVCGLPFVAPLLLVAVFLVNVASQSMKILVDATIQHECADVYRGRVFSVNDTAFNLCFVGGLFTAALTLPGNGKSAIALVITSTAFVLLAAWYWTTTARLATTPPDPDTTPTVYKS
ncbi:MFS transporter [Catellatospora sp. IY07-71]|uniref:MFS transporter n=1 Tax=Catellatospora sp. IY07-71 TaxID=2728827 RepID=UPI001BB3B541|nr:MFS transporter [Catellatospora sp. IY07-71]BCJ71781.1 MFS transporter [Catellatospora sp. IY07-71]